VAVAGSYQDPATFYFGACAGGVWKTEDGGSYWENVSDGFFRTAAVGAIAVSPSDPNVLYVGTGETAIRGNVSHGDGVYKSEDAGRTWRNIGLSDTRHIGRIRIHPQNPDLVYVAALGHAWGPNQARGVFRSTDGGQNWQQVLFKSERAGAVDLSLDPSNPRILYASIWQAQRYPWALSSGGSDSGLWRSTDGGETWTDLTRNPGLPLGVLGKIGVAASPAQPGRVWALVEAHDGALFRSDDFGDTWQRLSDDGSLRERAWYYMHLYADPVDPDTCWVLNMRCWKSVDGGASFSPIPTPHGDNHDLWIDPSNPRRIIEGNDGGACVSYNGGATWSTIYNQPTAQMYHVTTDSRIPYRVYGSQQDNSAISLPGASLWGAIAQTEWIEPGGGESGYMAVHPKDPEIVYGGAIGSGNGNGRLTRYDGHTVQVRNITVWPDAQGWADGADALRYRFQWTFPILISRHDPSILYVGANKLLRSRDEGYSWKEISPDLTRNDPSKLAASGGPITLDNTGAEVYCTIFALAESPHDPGLLWAGTDDGLVHLSRDAGSSWTDVTPPSLPEWALISIIEASPHDPGKAYVAATRYKLDDPTPYLYRTEDYGATWTEIQEGIPDGQITRVIREDPGREGLLFVGTETGIFVSFDDGGSWEPLDTNLPVVPIHDFVIKDDDLVVATHGRSFWILDDLSPLRQLQPAGLEGVHLFKPRPAVRLGVHPGHSYPSADGVNYRNAGPVGYAYRHRVLPDGTERDVLLDAGENPAYGALLTYYLAEVPMGEISLTIRDSEGREVRKYTSKKQRAPATDPREEPEMGAEGAEAGAGEPTGEETQKWLPRQRGLNRFAWDLRHEAAQKLPEDKSIAYFPQGPLALPGRYRVELQVGETKAATDLEVVKDPRTSASDADLRAMNDLQLRIRDKLSEVHRVVERIRELCAQLDAWEKSAAATNDAASVVGNPSLGGLSSPTRGVVPPGAPQGASRGAPFRVPEAARALISSLKSVEHVLIQTKTDSPLRFPSSLAMRLAALPSFGEGADAPPTDGMIGVFDDLSARIDEQLQIARRLVERDLARFNQLVRQEQIPALVAPNL
jgi:photosystem II stability/assembly factor-like uncharacterized protein